MALFPARKMATFHGLVTVPAAAGYQMTVRSGRLQVPAQFSREGSSKRIDLIPTGEEALVTG